MEDSVFEVVVRPSTWDGEEQDRRVGLFTTLLQAQEEAREWVRENRYPFEIGEWQTVICELPLNRSRVGYWHPYGKGEIVALLPRDDQGNLVERSVSR